MSDTTFQIRVIDEYRMAKGCIINCTLWEEPPGRFVLDHNSISLHLITALEKTNVDFIRTSCSLTTYPTLCFNSLSTRAGAIQTSPKLLAQTALSVTLDTTRTISSSMVKLSKVHGMTSTEVAAMKDCIELLNDSVYELQKSLEEMVRPGSKDSGMVMSDIQTWISSY